MNFTKKQRRHLIGGPHDGEGLWNVNTRIENGAQVFPMPFTLPEPIWRGERDPAPLNIRVYEDPYIEFTTVADFWGESAPLRRIKVLVHWSAFRRIDWVIKEIGELMVNLGFNDFLLSAKDNKGLEYGDDIVL